MLFKHSLCYNYLLQHPKLKPSLQIQRITIIAMIIHIHVSIPESDEQPHPMPLVVKSDIFYLRSESVVAAAVTVAVPEKKEEKDDKPKY